MLSTRARRIEAEAHMPPDIAQLAEHLTVDIRSHQMVPGSIPGVRIFVRRVRIDAFSWFVQMRLAIIFILASQKLPRRAQNGGANVSRAVRMCVCSCVPSIFWIHEPTQGARRFDRSTQRSLSQRCEDLFFTPQPNMPRPGIEPGTFRSAV